MNLPYIRISQDKNRGSVSNCVTHGKVTGTFKVGGIGGNVASVDVNYCINTATITSSNNHAGGILGYSDYSTTLKNSYNTGDVNGTSYVGGLIGGCYSSNTGNKVIHCYSIGNVTGTSYYGGLFGSAPYSYSFCYYLDTAVVNPTCTAGTAKSADQLKRATAFEQWDFTTIWTMAGDVDYPYPELIDTPSSGLPDHEHNYIAEITTPATHTTTGVKTYACDCCGHTYTEVIEKLTAHSYTEKVTAPTCIDKGYTTYTCICGDTYVDDYVDALGHSYSSEITTPATHTTTGLMTYTCTCGDAYTEVIEKITEHNHEAVVTPPQVQVYVIRPVVV